MFEGSERLLVLGAGTSELDVVHYAHTMSLYVVVTDSNTDWSLAPAKYAADAAWDISWSNMAELVARCKECRVDGVFAGFSEKRIECAMALCKLLDLPFYTDGSRTDIVFSKPAFMGLCSEVGFTIPKRFSIDDEVEFPVIVKPNGSASSLGISVCHDTEEYSNAIERGIKYSSDGTLEIESYIQNADEIIVWYLVRDKKITLLQTCDMYMKVLDSRCPQVPMGFRFPSKYNNLLIDDYDSLFRKLICLCEIRNGLIGFQCLVKNNDIIPYDPTYRVDSTMVHHVTEWIDGSNSLKMLINYSLRGVMDDGNEGKIAYPDRSGKLIYLLPVFIRNGLISSIDGIGALKLSDNTISVFENYRVGDRVSKTSVFSSLFATITFAVNDEDDLENTLTRILKTLEIKDDSGNDMVIKADYKSLIGVQ